METTPYSPVNKTIVDKFILLMNLPEPLKNLQKKYNQFNDSVGINRETVALSITSANIPNVSIKAQAIKYGGGNLYVSTHTKTPYEPMEIKFKIDSGYRNYFTIYQWLNYTYNEEEGHFDSEHLESSDEVGIDSYATNISIVGLDEYDKPVIQWIFTKAFPTMLSKINLDYQKTSEIECTCTFVFSQLYIRNMELEELKTSS